MNRTKIVALLTVCGLLFVAANIAAFEGVVKSFGDGGSFKHHQAYQTTDGGTLIVGQAATGVNEGGLVLKLNINNVSVWQKRYGIHNGCSLYSAWETTAGNYLLAGNSLDYQGMLLEVDSQNGSILSRKKYGGTSALHTIEAVADGFVVTGYHYDFATGYQFVVMKLASDLTVDWRTAIQESSSKVRVEAIQELSNGNLVCVVPASGALACLDHIDGSLLWSKQYQEGGSTIKVTGICSTGDGQLALAAEVWNSLNKMGIVVFKVNQDGSQPQAAKKLDGPNSESPTNITLTADNDFLLSALQTSNPYRTMLFRLSSSLGVVWQKALTDNVHRFDSPGNVREYAGELYFTSSYYPDPNNSFDQPVIFARLNPQGAAGAGCQLLHPSNLTVIRTALTAIAVTLTTDQTVYSTTTTSTLALNPTGITEYSFPSCQQSYPRLSVSFNTAQGARVVGVELNSGSSGVVLDCDSGDCSALLESGTTVELTAYPQAGYSFSHWEYGNGGQSTNNPAHVLVVDNTSWEAVFN